MDYIRFVIFFFKVLGRRDEILLVEDGKRCGPVRSARIAAILTRVWKRFDKLKIAGLISGPEEE